MGVATAAQLPITGEGPAGISLFPLPLSVVDPALAPAHGGCRYRRRHRLTVDLFRRLVVGSGLGVWHRRHGCSRRFRMATCSHPFLCSTMSVPSPSSLVLPSSLTAAAWGTHSLLAGDVGVAPPVTRKRRMTVTMVDEAAVAVATAATGG